MKKLLLAFSLFASFGALSAFAQDGQPLPNSRIKTHYDRFKDVTRIDLQDARVENLSGGPTLLNFSVSCAFIGQKPSGAMQTVIILAAKSDEWAFLKRDLTLRAILNEKERLEIGGARRDVGDAKSGYVVEVVSVEITIKNLQKLASAKKVEMQVGAVEFELPPQTISDLQDLLLRIVPAQPD